MKRRLIVMLLLSIVVVKTCLADNNVTQVSRYITISNHTRSSQTNLLSQLIQVRFTKNIQTIGDAMNYLLRFSGYSLIPENKMDSAFKITLTKPLPIIDRELGPIKLSDGLRTLAGPAFDMMQDPVNRIVDFKLKPEYRKYIRS